MDKGEIVTSYRQAADQKKQLGILAELNACSREQIVEILEEAGVKVDRRWIGRPRGNPSRPPVPPKAPKQARTDRQLAVSAPVNVYELEHKLIRDLQIWEASDIQREGMLMYIQGIHDMAEAVTAAMRDQCGGGG